MLNNVWDATVNDFRYQKFVKTDWDDKHFVFQTTKKWFSSLLRSVVTLKMVKLVLIAVVASVYLQIVYSATITSPAINEDQKIQQCRVKTPCGWEIYNPKTRVHDMFVKLKWEFVKYPCFFQIKSLIIHSCECPENMICQRLGKDRPASILSHHCSKIWSQ